MIIELILLFLIILVGGFVQGASGFGLGLVVMGFLPLLLTIKESTLLVMVLLLVSALTIMKRVYQHVMLKGILMVIAAAIVGRIGAYFVLTTYGEMDIMKQWLGFFLIGMVIYLIVTRKAPEKEQLHPIIPIILGFLGGFVGGVFAVGGPFFVFYFLMIYKDKRRYSANLQVIVIVTSVMSLVLHGVSGDFYPEFALYVVVGVVSAMIGTQLGMRWFEKLPSHVIRNFAMTLVFLAGINLILFAQ
ncbi:sulfite exporter TauE/SafE family protein [Alteribacter aurantiacus]|uniref:sulfite exporter TauE/SafE family protein n=1 Tax=Alteribacter aurantiacus TaxID=254410 RepID=UPI000401562A|nr:sulfite exporter TauE/SafE family protein [Alteribacter aurantiacus]